MPLDAQGNYYADDTVLAAAAAASAARTATAAGAAFSAAQASSLEGTLTVTVVSGTLPTLDVILETSIDGGTTWTTVGAFAQIVAAGNKQKVFGPLGDLCRWSWTIGGSATPTFTFSIAAEANK